MAVGGWLLANGCWWLAVGVGVFYGLWWRG